MIPNLNVLATVTRTVAVSSPRVVSVNDSPTPRPFFCSLVPPTSSKSTDGSPRDLPSYAMRFTGGALGGPPMRAGHRVRLVRITGRPYENTVYELLTDPKEFWSGAVAQGWEAPIAQVSVLYPYTGILKEQTGTTVGAIAVALWDDRENEGPTGTYEDFRGEASALHSGQLRGNRYIDLGGARYRLLTELMDYEGPRVRFTARLSNA